MYNVVDLNPIELEMIDPTGMGRASLRRMKDSKPTPVPLPYRLWSREEWLARYREHRNKSMASKYHRLIEFDEEQATKYGPQGDSFSLSELQNSYKNSYMLAERRVNCAPLYRGRDYLLSYIRSLIERYGGPTYVVGRVEGTSGALPTMSKKGSFWAETVGATNWRHAFWNLPGQRSQRLKHRCINQDACANVRYIEGMLASVRGWLKTYLPRWFSAWLNPRVVTDVIFTRSLEKGYSSVETDYAACDEHFGLEIAMELILPVYEELLTPGEFMHFAAFIEELFYQPIFFGTYGWTGKHNLLSGQAITNDFETIFGLIKQLTACLNLGIDLNKVEFVELGDDIACLTAPGIDAERVKQELMRLGREAGMEYSDQKCHVRKGSISFCRRWYELGLPREYNSDGVDAILGYYPGSLVMNNLINPERHAETYADLIVASLQRTDNYYGAPNFNALCQWFYSKVRLDIANTDLSNVTLVDWWSRVYGATWELSKSPTYHNLKVNHLL